MPANEKVKHWLELMSGFNIDESKWKQLEFFFYADTEDATSNLMIDLHQLGYTLYKTHRLSNRFSVSGITPPMSIDEQLITAWADAVEELAEKHGVVFDGWGMGIETDEK